MTEFGRIADWQVASKAEGRSAVDYSSTQFINLAMTALVSPNRISTRNPTGLSLAYLNGRATPARVANLGAAGLVIGAFNAIQ